MMDTASSSLPVLALLAMSAALGACGPTPTRAPTSVPAHLAVGSFAITSARDRLDVAEDGVISRGGARFGRVSSDGRFTDETEKLVLEVDAEGWLSEPGNPRSGRLRGDGTVEWNGSKLVTIDSAGVIGGTGVQDLHLSLRHEGPAQTRPAAALIVAGVVRLVQLGRRIPGAGGASPASPQETADAVCSALVNSDEGSLRAAMLTPDQLAAITTKTIDRAELEAELDEWIHARILELAGAGATCAPSEISAIETHPAGDKRRRDVRTARATLVFRIGERESRALFQLVLIAVDQHGQYWRAWFRQ